MIKLFVGLGNPGPQYRDTRHNAGFWFIDTLAASLKVTLAMDRSFHGMLGRCAHRGHSICLLQPQTFMNLSGKSVAALARFYKITSDEILVVHDELDIVPGEAKLKFDGSHAGHNGLRDIHAQLGSAAYWRLRIGIGHPGSKAEVVDWVLQIPSLDHKIAIGQAIDRSLRAVPDLLDGNMTQAMLTVHTSKAPRPKPERQVRERE